MRAAVYVQLTYIMRSSELKIDPGVCGHNLFYWNASHITAQLARLTASSK